MRLSEAILLGSTLLRPVAGDLELPSDRGALGMAERAVGAGWSYWPWLLTMRVATPCRCPFQPLPAAWVVTHLFGCHVAEEFLDSFRNRGWVRSDERWTLEQLVDWVRSVEPAEAETRRRAIDLFQPITSVLENGVQPKPTLPHAVLREAIDSSSS